MNPRTNHGSAMFLRLLLVLTVSAVPISGWVRLHTSGAIPYFWPPASLPLEFTLNDQGSDNVPDASDDEAMRRGFDAWAQLAGASVAFNEDGGSSARTDWEADDLHLVLFDETNSSGFFPDNSGIVAVTPTQFFTNNGRVVDADIVFNGKEFQFSTDLSPGSFDIQGVGTHEIGHFIGLGHTSMGGATMAPFTSQASFAPRTLTADDAAGAAELYPGPTAGSISGSVTLNGQPVNGAHVWARDAVTGRVATSAYSVNGNYTLTGLDAGNYDVLAAPINEPLDQATLHGPSSELGGVPGGFDLAFQPGSVGPVAVFEGAAAFAPALEVGADTTLSVFNPRSTLGVRRGTSVDFPMGIIGAPSLTSVLVPGQGVTVDEAISFGQTGLQLTLSVAADAPLGLMDVEFARPDGDRTIWAGFLEVLPAPMLVNSIDPPCAPSEGGAEVLLLGTGLKEVAHVFLGTTEAAILSQSPEGTSLVFESPAGFAGSTEILLVDVAGGEARVEFHTVAGSAPSLSSVFPTAGQAGGGTLLTLLGTGFDADTAVELNFVPVAVTLQEPGRIQVLTPGGAPGPVAVSVRHGECLQLFDSLPQGFTYSPSPDPVVTSANPQIISRDGNQALAVLGDFFTGTETVQLFADPQSGLGGTLLNTGFASAQQLDAVTPEGPLPVGEISLMVRRSNGAAAFLPGGVVVAPVLGTARRLSGSLDGPGDSDPAFVHGLAGTFLTVIARRIGKSDLKPSLVLSDPDEQPLISTDKSLPAFDSSFVVANSVLAMVRRFQLPSTGVHRIDVGAVSGSGNYRVDVIEALPVSARRIVLAGKNAVPLGPETHEISFDAQAGARVTGVVFGRPADGLLPLIELRDPDGQLLVSVADGGVLSGDPDAVAATTVLAKGRLLRLRLLTLPKFGTYTLTLSASTGTSGPATTVLSLLPLIVRESITEGS